MGMYVLNQYQIKVAKNENGKNLVQGVAKMMNIQEHDLPENIEPKLLGFVNTVIPRYGSNRMDQIEDIFESLANHFCDAAFAPKGTPEQALRPFIQEKEDAYVIYFATTCKGGMFVVEEGTYTKGFFNEASGIAKTLQNIVEDFGGLVAFDVKSETEHYKKRPLQKVI